MVCVPQNAGAFLSVLQGLLPVASDPSLAFSCKEIFLLAQVWARCDGLCLPDRIGTGFVCLSLEWLSLGTAAGLWVCGLSILTWATGTSGRQDLTVTWVLKSAVAVPDIQVGVPAGSVEIIALEVRLENSVG